MKNLVILGGGYGGIKVLTGLLNTSLPDDIQIIVVDKNPYHSYKTEFHTIVAGTAADIDVRTNFPKDDRVKYEYGLVRHIDTEAKEISFENMSKIVSFDYLVFVFGCEDSYNGIEGAAEFTTIIPSFSNVSRDRIPLCDVCAW